ncbi:LPXTG cell wall anchor domain-containing protein, partial [Clostridioides difficile]
LGGKQLVTFEELYDLSNPDEPIKVAEHKDIEDDGQTVTIKEVPETPTPEEPEKPTTPDTPTKTDSPKTGDNTNILAFAIMMFVSAGGLAGTYFFKRRKMKKS